MRSDKLKTRKDGENIVVYLKGNLDVHESSKLEESLDDLRIKNPDYNFILEMHDVEHMSSSGLRVLVALMRELNSKGRELRLCRLSRPVEKIFGIVELLDMFNIYKTESAALKGIHE